MRTATITRQTGETKITVELNLDQQTGVEIQTGIGYFDHMLNLFAKHGRFGLKVTAQGDLEVDAHHTVEDTGIVLGECFKQALGDKAQIERYGDAWVPMDEVLAQVVVDLSGRSYLVFDSEFENPRLGDYETEVTETFSKPLPLQPKWIYMHGCYMAEIRTTKLKRSLRRLRERCVRP